MKDRIKKAKQLVNLIERNMIRIYTKGNAYQAKCIKTRAMKGEITLGQIRVNCRRLFDMLYRVSGITEERCIKRLIDKGLLIETDTDFPGRRLKTRTFRVCLEDDLPF